MLKSAFQDLAGRKKKENDIRMPSNLNAAEQKQVKAIVEKREETELFRIRRRTVYLLIACFLTESAV